MVGVLISPFLSSCCIYFLFCSNSEKLYFISNIFLLGHTMVPKVYQDNQALSSWVFRQRKHFRLREQEKAHSMTDQRLEQLNDVSGDKKLFTSTSLRTRDSRNSNG